MSEIQELVDRQEITDVMHSYCRFVDLNLPEKQVECFTIDAAADYYGGTELVGRGAILEMLQEALTRFIATCHTLSNIEISFESPNTANSISYVQAWHRKPSGPEDDYEVRGQYHDRWLKTEEGWRISYRKFLTMAATPPRPDAPGIGRIS
tara:strand:- start:470 stop:922 length:453 start_codon:yes stop_codon:yes gene_type:complete